MPQLRSRRKRSKRQRTKNLVEDDDLDASSSSSDSIEGDSDHGSMASLRPLNTLSTRMVSDKISDRTRAKTRGMDTELFKGLEFDASSDDERVDDSTSEDSADDDSYIRKTPPITRSMKRRRKRCDTDGNMSDLARDSSTDEQEHSSSESLDESLNNRRLLANKLKRKKPSFRRKHGKRKLPGIAVAVVVPVLQRQLPSNRRKTYTIHDESDMQLEDFITIVDENVSDDNFVESDQDSYESSSVSEDEGSDEETADEASDEETADEASDDETADEASVQASHEETHVEPYEQSHNGSHVDSEDASVESVESESDADGSERTCSRCHANIAAGDRPSNARAKGARARAYTGHGVAATTQTHRDHGQAMSYGHSHTMGFGMYAKQSLFWVYTHDRGYCQWARSQKTNATGMGWGLTHFVSWLQDVEDVGESAQLWR